MSRLSHLSIRKMTGKLKQIRQRDRKKNTHNDIQIDQMRNKKDYIIMPIGLYRLPREHN